MRAAVAVQLACKAETATRKQELMAVSNPFDAAEEPAICAFTKNHNH